MSIEQRDTHLYLVMDMINDLVHQDSPAARSPLGLEAARRQVVQLTATAIAAARGRGMRVGFVRIAFSPDYRECADTSRRFIPARQAGLFNANAWGTQIHPSLDVQENDLQVVKHRVSPFYGTDLDLLLRVLGVRKVFLSGVSTNGVVHSAVRDLADRDLPCTVLEDCCAAATDEEHRFAIGCMRGFADIATSSEVFA